MPQKGASTVLSLNKVVDAVVYDSCPCRAVAFTDKVVDIPVLVFRSGIQSSTALNDNFEAKRVLCRLILRHFSDSPESGWVLGSADFSSRRR